MKKMPFGEADFLVRAMTKDFGKIDVLAKGARKSASKLNSHLDILNHIRMGWVRPAHRGGGNGERLPTLTDAEIISRFDDWFLDSDKISIAGRILKVLDIMILPGVEDEELFSMVLEFFKTEINELGSEAPKLLEKKATKFLREFFMHEGHGDSLPEEHKDNIIRLWPILMT